MKELVIISGKGGTGKTSVLGALASLVQNAVFADCDVDAANLYLLLKPDIGQRHDFYGGRLAYINPELCTSCGVCRDVCRFDAVTPDYKVDEIACEGCGVCVWNCPENAISFNEHKNGEWFISQTRFGDLIHAKLGIAEENSGKLVTLVRKKAKERAAQNANEFILVDGPPGTGCPVIAAIGGADLVVIVVEPSLSAIHDMQRVVKLTRHFKIPSVVVVNKYDLNENLTRDITSFCEDQTLPIAGVIPYDLNIVQAQMAGQTIIEYGKTPLKNRFVKIWHELEGMLKPDDD